RPSAAPAPRPATPAARRASPGRPAMRCPAPTVWPWCVDLAVEGRREGGLVRGPQLVDTDTEDALDLQRVAADRPDPLARVGPLPAQLGETCLVRRRHRDDCPGLRLGEQGDERIARH